MSTESVKTENIQHKVRAATVWSSITEIASKFVTPVVNMILARLLLPEAFGIVAVVTMVISFAEVFTDAGFQKYIVQHEFEDDQKLNKCTTVAFWTNLSLAAVICGVIFFFRDGIATMVGSPDLGGVIAISSLLIVISGWRHIALEYRFKTTDINTNFHGSCYINHVYRLAYFITILILSLIIFKQNNILKL